MAVDRASGEACVVKVFEAGARARAVAEFGRLRGLEHPSIVRVRDIGRLADGRLYLVTDLVAGPGVDHISGMSNEEARRSAFDCAALDLASAVGHLHARGIVHGDICPANVRLTEGSPGRWRPVLIDFGFAGPPLSGGGGARGTLGYAAPEALTGARTPAADLFSLGATLFEAWSGTAPFGRGLPSVARTLEGPAPSLSSVRPGLAEGWNTLLGRLLAADPARRPASARALLRDVHRLVSGSATPTEIDLGIPYPEGDPLAGVFVGRRAERAALRRALDRLADGEVDAGALVLVGGPGTGRRTLFDLVARDVAVAAAAGAGAAVEVWRGDMEALERLAGLTFSPAGDADPVRLAEARMAGVAAWMEARAAHRPLCVFLDEGRAARSFATFVSGAAPTGRTLVVLPDVDAIERPFAAAIEPGPFGASDILELVSAGVEVTPPPQTIELIVQTAGPSAGIAVALARRLVASLRAGEGGRLHLDGGTADLGALLQSSFRVLPADAQRAVLAVALGGQAAVDVVLADDPRDGGGLRAARDAGWIAEDDDGNLRAPSAAHRLAAQDAAHPELATRVATVVLGLLEKDDPRRADVLVTLGRRTEAADALRRAAAQQVAGDRGLGAAELLGRARALAPNALTSDERLVLASGLGALGRYDEAADVLAEARARVDGPAAELKCLEREAWLLTRRGNLEAARALLERAIGDHPEPGITAALRTRLGRLLVTAGRFREALDVVEPFLAPGLGDDSGGVQAPLALEAALLASAYLGDGPAANRRLAELGRWPSVGSGKLAYLEGLVAQLGGDERAAGEAYRRAFEIAARDNDVHTVAAVAVNLGGLLTEEGLLGEALIASERAVRELGRLGATAELGPALVNAANLFVQLGDLPAARRALERARGLVADRRHPTRVGATAAFVEGDSWRRAGDLDAATAAYRRAASLFVEVGQPGAVAALTAACEALAARGRLDEGRQAFAEARALAGDPDGDQDPDLLRAEGLLALAGIALGDPSSLAARLDQLGRSLAARRRRPRAWRLAALAARLFARAGQAEAARSALELARQLFEEVRMATPEHHRAALDRDPETAWLAGEGGAPSGEGALAARALAAESRLRRLLRINKRVNSELRLPRLLEMIVDTVIELTDAERGFLLLEDDGGVLNVKVARNIDERTLDSAELELSRSIARQAAAGGEPVVTIDAAGDARFREALSVSDLHLRSVLAVPLSIKGKVVGTIYVDHRLRKGAFDQEDVRLVQDFAEQAAIAIENARLLGELRRRERQVDALNRRLEGELAARREELSGIKVELRESREALAVRYDYRNIVGRTPRMLELFRLIDRITDTSLPVVVQGESGTGKELVARALHSNGPRRSRPFVGENCAAIPETLLESTLFGYVRGAFTGAEHDTRGLFEIADGGTLFLDEVGEMSPAMQGKLLRVLQEGELRRVGSERTRKVDVRVIAATNRDLARLVEEGKFRSDLFFRLNVASITLPALRERRDDIPLLVEHFLIKLAKAAGRDAPRPIDPAALARLCAYRWPGNVRELENELMRAEALSTGRISAGDLSPRLTAADEAGALIAENPDSLTLKPRVERLERSLLREALVRSGNNQTKAAELLGLSRFGLQKKLKRYHFG